jgi:hypothetical protein
MVVEWYGPAFLLQGKGLPCVRGGAAGEFQLLLYVSAQLLQLALHLLIGLAVLLHPFEPFDLFHSLADAPPFPVIPDILDVLSRTAELPYDFVGDSQLDLIDLAVVDLADRSLDEVAIDGFVHQWTGIQQVLHLVVGKAVLVLQELAE